MKKQVLVLALAVLAGCASQETRKEPEWLDGTSKQYPGVRYLSGLGQGSSAALARDHARSEVAKNFATSISEQSLDMSASESIQQGEDVRSKSEQRTERRIETQTARVLEGVSVVGNWRDEKGTHHAFAVLDRVSAAGKLRSEVKALDDAIEREIAGAQRETDLLARIRAAAQAAAMQRTREALQRDLRVLDVAGVGVPSSRTLARLEGDFRELAGRLRLAGTAPADTAANLASLLQGAIAHAGFSSAGQPEADYQLNAQLQLDAAETQGWHWSRGTLALTMTDTAGQVRGTLSLPIKMSAQDAAVARQRAISEAERLMRERLRAFVLGTEGETH